MNRILDIFYNQFLEEARIGKIDCYFRYNILFGNFIDGKLNEAIEIDNTVVPVLKILNKDLFNTLLVNYVEKALKFYEFQAEIKEDETLKIKQIMAFLFANATYEDFENPIELLMKRISFLDDQILPNLSEIFRSESLDALIEVETQKGQIHNETPYEIKIKLKSSTETFYLPIIYVGINGNKAYIFAIQNSKELETYNGKKLKRKLYQLDANFDVANDTFANFDIGNLKDITHSFLLAVNIMVGILKERGINEFIVPSILPIRWNSKEISANIRSEHYQYSPAEREELLVNHEKIQANLTEKLIRTFLRLAYHHSGISVIGYPSEADMSLHLSVTEPDECNNEILAETYRSRGGFHV